MNHNTLFDHQFVFLVEWLELFYQKLIYWQPVLFWVCSPLNPVDWQLCPRGEKPSDCKDVCDGHHIPKAAWLIGHLHSFFFCRCPVQVYLVFAFTVLFVVFACNWPSKIPKHNTYLRPSWAYSWSNWPTAGSVCCNFRCPIMHWNTPGHLGAKNVCFEFLIS